MGTARPEASTTKSAETLCDVPPSSSYRTVTASRRSADGATSVTRDRWRSSTLGSCLSRRRQTCSSKGRERQKASKPRSRCGKGSKPGCSYRTERPARDLDGASFQKIASDAGEQRFERRRASGKQGMRVPRLRRSGSRIGSLRQRVSVEHGDLVEMGRDRFRGGEATHSCSNNNGMVGDGWHRRASPYEFAGTPNPAGRLMRQRCSFSRRHSWRLTVHGLGPVSDEASLARDGDHTS